MKKLRPVMRWTIGGSVTIGGIEAQVESIRLIRRIYDDKFDLFLCHNNLVQNIHTKKMFEHCRSNNVTIINQEDYYESISIRPDLAAWVLYPPRLKQDAHEIFIDNDLIIHKRMPILDNFLKSNHFIISTGCTRAYGAFQGYVPKKLRINSGFFGLPPGYDFSTDIQKWIRRTGKKRWTDHLDSQGIIAVSVTKKKNKIIIPREDLQLSNRKGRLNMGKYGTHFIRLNGTSKHSGWTQYKEQKIKFV